MAVSLLYDYADFSDTDSEFSHGKKLDKRRKNRWDELRREADLTTVKESQGEYNISYRPISSLRGFNLQHFRDDKMPQLFMPKPDQSVVSADDADDIAQKTDKDDGRLKDNLEYEVHSYDLG